MCNYNIIYRHSGLSTFVHARPHRTVPVHEPYRTCSTPRYRTEDLPLKIFKTCIKDIPYRTVKRKRYGNFPIFYPETAVHFGR